MKLIAVICFVLFYGAVGALQQVNVCAWPIDQSNPSLLAKIDYWIKHEKPNVTLGMLNGFNGVNDNYVDSDIHDLEWAREYYSARVTKFVSPVQLTYDNQWDALNYGPIRIGMCDKENNIATSEMNISRMQIHSLVSGLVFIPDSSIRIVLHVNADNHPQHIEILSLSNLLERSIYQDWRGLAYAKSALHRKRDIRREARARSRSIKSSSAEVNRPPMDKDMDRVLVGDNTHGITVYTQSNIKYTVSVTVKKARLGRLPYIAQPVKADNNTQQPGQVPEKTILQKYWWVFLLFILLQAVSSGANSAQAQQAESNGEPAN